MEQSALWPVSIIPALLPWLLERRNASAGMASHLCRSILSSGESRRSPGGQSLVQVLLRRARTEGHEGRCPRPWSCSCVGSIFSGICGGAPACAHAPTAAMASVADAHVDRSLARRPAFLPVDHRAHRSRQSRGAHRRGRQDCDRTSGRFFTRRSERLAGSDRLYRHTLGGRAAP